MSGSKLKPSNELGRLFAELCGAWNLKPYWGKPTVRNFRGGGWRRDHGSRTEAHVERRGTAAGPYRARASAPPDRGRHLMNRWRERSEANCLTSGCKSRRRRSPCGAVVISGSPRGNPKAGSPEVKALDGQVGSEPPRVVRQYESERTKRRNEVPARS
jgi:hypothetical protein